MLVLSALTLALALAFPPLRRKALEREIDEAAADVRAVSIAAERFRDVEDRWPEPTDVGEVPPELGPYLPPGFSFDRDGYRLDFDVWERAEEAPPLELPEIGTNRPPGLLPDSTSAATDLFPEPTEAPPGLLPDTTVDVPKALFGFRVAITVHSGQTRLLAGLLERFGDRRSFVHGGTWTLIVATTPGR